MPADKTLFVGPLDRVLFLRTLPAFDGLGPAHLAAVAQHANERTFPRGTPLLDPDGPAEAVFLVVEGEVSVTRPGGRSRSAGPGEAVGFVDLLARAERGVRARASIDTLALELDWDAQLDVCEEHFPVLAQYLRYLAMMTIRELERDPSAIEEVTPADLPVHQRRPLNLVERILVLSHSRAFSTSSLDALAELAHHVTEVRFAAGEEIWRKDATAEDFLLVAAGAIRGTLSGKRQLRARAASTVGMQEALRGGRRWYDAMAEATTVALRIEVEPLVDILEDHFDLAVDFMSTLARRLLEYQDRPDPER